MLTLSGGDTAEGKHHHRRPHCLGKAWFVLRPLVCECSCGRACGRAVQGQDWPDCWSRWLSAGRAPGQLTS